MDPTGGLPRTPDPWQFFRLFGDAQQGTSFHIYDQPRFASEVLPYYFKHNNISSFIRQLNMYGFRKVPNMEHGGLKVERDDLEFQHPFFVRGCEELLDRIKRKGGQTKAEQRPVSVNSESLTKVLTELNQIKDKQDTFSSRVGELERENQVLWRETIKLSKKYRQQQAIINKLMRFLMSLVNTHGRGMPGLPRKRPLMINAPDPSSSTDPSPSKKANIVLNEAVDHDYTVQSPADLQTQAVPNTSGVVIQELLDQLEPAISASDAQATSPANFGTVNSVPAMTVPDLVAASPDFNFFEMGDTPADPAAATTAAATPSSFMQQFLEPESSNSPMLLPSQPGASVSPHQQQQKHQPQQQTSEEPLTTTTTSQQIALRGLKDKSLSSSSSPQSPKDFSEQINILQCDLDSVRDVLSSGQFNLDPNFILGLFDPETPLPVSIDTSLVDHLSGQGTSAGDQAPSAPVQLPGASSDITGNELSLLGFLPADNLPTLFDELEGEVPTSEDDAVYYEDEDSGLNTPTVTDIRPNLSGAGQFMIGDLD
ncbi:hypothetical protein ACOMHN_032196 [Nucella lapillus]